jgi:uncharacterized protein (TIGR02466 family)
MNHNIILFGVPLQINILNIDTESLTEYSYKIKEKTKGRTFSNLGGWQSDNLNLKDLELQPFIEELKKNIMSYIIQCGFKTDLEYKLNDLWININGFKDINKPHIHPGCLFSGVYYIKTPDNCGNIYFKHPSDLMQYDWLNHLKKGIESNSYEWYFISKKKDMYLFPSWLYHYVTPNLNKKEDRISLAFNIGL